MGRQAKRLQRQADGSVLATSRGGDQQASGGRGAPLRGNTAGGGAGGAVVPPRGGGKIGPGVQRAGGTYEWECYKCHNLNVGIQSCACGRPSPNRAYEPRFLNGGQRAGGQAAGKGAHEQRKGGQAARAPPQAPGNARADAGTGVSADLQYRKLTAQLAAANKRAADLEAAAAGAAAAAKAGKGDGMEVDGNGDDVEEAPGDEVKALRAELAYLKAHPFQNDAIQAEVLRVEASLHAATMAMRTGKPLRVQLAGNAEYIGRLQKKRAGQEEKNKHLLAVLAQAQLELTQGQAELKATDDLIQSAEIEKASLTQRAAVEEAKGVAEAASSPAAAVAAIMVQLQGAMACVEGSTSFSPQMAQTVAHLAGQLNEQVAAEAALHSAAAGAGAAPPAPPAASGAGATPPSVAAVVPPGVVEGAPASAVVAAAAPAAAAAAEVAAAGSAAAAAAPAAPAADAAAANNMAVDITLDEQLVLLQQDIKKRGGSALANQQPPKKR